jgi:hypothetical protein
MNEIVYDDGQQAANPRSRELKMQFLWFALFVAVAAAGAWFLGRTMTSAGRNEGSKHGGGIDEANIDAA